MVMRESATIPILTAENTDRELRLIRGKNARIVVGVMSVIALITVVIILLLLHYYLPHSTFLIVGIVVGSIWGVFCCISFVGTHFIGSVEKAWDGDDADCSIATCCYTLGISITLSIAWFTCLECIQQQCISDGDKSVCRHCWIV